MVPAAAYKMAPLDRAKHVTYIITLVLYLYFLRTEIPGRLVPVGALKGLCGGAPPAPPGASRPRSRQETGPSSRAEFEPSR